MPREEKRQPLTEYREGSFYLECVGGPWKGYTLNEGWNGWATPRFARAEADAIAAAFRDRFGCDFAYDEATGKYLFAPCDHVCKETSATMGSEFTCENNSYDEAEVFGYYDHPTLGRLYLIGTFGWTWLDAECMVCGADFPSVVDAGTPDERFICPPCMGTDPRV